MNNNMFKRDIEYISYLKNLLMCNKIYTLISNVSVKSGKYFSTQSVEIVHFSRKPTEDEIYCFISRNKKNFLIRNNYRAVAEAYDKARYKK